LSLSVCGCVSMMLAMRSTPGIGVLPKGWAKLRVYLVGRYSKDLADPAAARPTAATWRVHVKHIGVRLTSITARGLERVGGAVISTYRATGQ
jgi:hypothetical protein